MGIRFEHKELVWLLAALVLLVLLFVRILIWKRKTSRRIGDPALVKVLKAGYSPGFFNFKFALLSVAFAAGVIAVMNMRKPAAAEGISRKGIDVVIALDVSRSMLATDQAPSRLERAKQFIGKLMNDMPDDRIGLVLFAGKAYLQMPLTPDHGAAWMFVTAASPASVPFQGTVISEALKRSVGAFNAAERRFKSVILISDGEGHDDEASATAKELAEQGVMINAVGIGSPDGAYIPDPATGENKKDETGASVISKLNEAQLKEIAEYTNGVYVQLQNTDAAVATIKSQLSQIESKAYGDVSLMNYKTYYWWFAGVMLFLLLAEFFLPEIKKKKMA